MMVVSLRGAGVESAWNPDEAEAWQGGLGRDLFRNHHDLFEALVQLVR
jgi:hypothetical protein